jgi:hypothetical protein
VANLSVRTIAAHCGIVSPLSLKQDILGFEDDQIGSLKEQLVLMQAKCMPWEVISKGPDHSKDMAVHAALMPTKNRGEILYFGGYTVNDTHLFDVETEKINDISAINSPDSNTFCSGHAFLANGYLLVGGGTLRSNIIPHHQIHESGANGERRCWLYNPWADQDEKVWKGTIVEDMNFKPGSKDRGGGRWYPTFLTLANGEILAVGGHPDATEDENGNPVDERHNNNTPERYSLSSNKWTLLTPDITAENGVNTDSYPRIHLLPNGHVFFTTVVKDEELKNLIYDPMEGKFLEGKINEPGETIYRRGSNATSVLLPLVPNENYTARVMVCGGKQPMRIELSNFSEHNLPIWEAAGTRALHDRDGLGIVRNHLCATILPNGKIFISGGTTDGEDKGCVLKGEIYDPGIDWGTETYITDADNWKTVEEATVKRHYHSVALLMPNGVVWTAGSNTDGTSSGENEGEKRIEVYRPSYVGKANRPEITRNPESLIYGQTFEIHTPQAANIQRIAMIRNGSVTHAFNSDQRYVGLKFSHAGGDRLTVTAPPWGGVAPPGYYMLWIVDDADRPCKLAKFVQLSALSVRITAASCEIGLPLSLKRDFFGSSNNRSLKQQLISMQRQCMLDRQ